MIRTFYTEMASTYTSETFCPQTKIGAKMFQMTVIDLKKPYELQFPKC